MSKLVRDHVRSNVVGYVAVFLALTMGTAYATHPGGADTISTEDIINNQVRSADIGNNQVKSSEVADDTVGGGGLTAADLAPASVTSSELGVNAILADGFGSEGSSKMANSSVGANELKLDSVRSNTVLNNTLTGTDILDGTVDTADVSSNVVGARAYGLVFNNGFLSNAKNVDGVTHPTLGRYCIDPGAGIDPATSVLIAGLNANNNLTGPGDSVVVAWDAAGPGCPDEALTVTTLLHEGDQLDDDDGGGNSTGDVVALSDQGFAFMIP